MLDKVSLNKFNRLTTNLGRTLLAAKFPKEFETYLMSLELVDSLGRTVDSITFPVMPNNIQKTENNRINVKKSGLGISVISSDSKTISELLIKGDFGRSFKLFLQPQKEEVNGFAFRGLKLNTSEFQIGIKTGFGAIKYLQNIISRVSSLDDIGQPMKLVLYNMALGEIYFVVPAPNGIMYSQNQEKNMIWSYSLNFIILSDAFGLKSSLGSSSTVNLLGAAIIQNGVNIVGSEIRSLL